MIRCITHRAADPDRVIIPEITAYFSYYHRHGIGGKAHILCDVKIIDSFYKPYTPDLKQIIGVLPSVCEALNHAENQSEISLYQILSRFAAALTHLFEKLHLFFLFEHF